MGAVNGEGGDGDQRHADVGEKSDRRDAAQRPAGRRARRLAITSPARPEADSTEVNAIVVIVSAKISPDHVGALPRWIGSGDRVGLK